MLVVSKHHINLSHSIHAVSAAPDQCPSVQRECFNQIGLYYGVCADIVVLIKIILFFDPDKVFTDTEVVDMAAYAAKNSKEGGKIAE